jgi:benzil reductase ((S)-benzoin forming)
VTNTGAEGRTAVVTGASRGLGAGIARELARSGLRLALCARSAPALPEGDRVLAERLDVTDGDAVERFAGRAASRFGQIDLWINNAGVLEPIAPLRDVRSEEFASHMAVNVLGVFHGTRAFVRHLRSRGGEGVLVNISSGASSNAYAGWSAYCAAKAAVDLLTRCVQLEEGEHGLRAHALAPGVIDTDMQELIRACTPERFPSVERFRELKQTGRFNSPEFVAREILALAFDPVRRPEGVLVRLPDEHA